MNNTTIMDDKNLVLRVQMTGEKIGQILSAQGESKGITGFFLRQLLGQNITNLVPSFFREQHQMILKGLSKKLNESIES